MAEYVSVPLAAKSAGIPERTIRNWIRGGKLAAIRNDRGYTVRVQDVRAVAEVAGRAAAIVGMAGDAARSKAGEVAAEERDVQRAARVIEEAMRPLVEEIGALREQLGRERAMREAAEAERDRLREEMRRVGWWRRMLGGL